jgi:hypothetical protein
VWVSNIFQQRFNYIYFLQSFLAHNHFKAYPGGLQVRETAHPSVTQGLWSWKGRGLDASQWRVIAVQYLKWQKRVPPDFTLSLSAFPVNFLSVLVCFGGFCDDGLCEHFPWLCEIGMMFGLYQMYGYCWLLVLSLTYPMCPETLGRVTAKLSCWVIVTGQCETSNTVISWGIEQRPGLFFHFLYHNLGQLLWPRLHYLLILWNLMWLKSYLETN